jgi:hypothetical protein
MSEENRNEDLTPENEDDNIVDSWENEDDLDGLDDSEDSDDSEEEKSEEPISKHKIKDKHRLKHDSIFKGKKETLTEEDFNTMDLGGAKQQSFEPSVSSNYYFERENPYEYQRLNKLKEDVYDVIVNDIQLNIKNSRRKPSKVDFNRYFSVLVERIDMVKFSHSEVFLELAYYFSDNIENMFKLLDEKWGGKISMELAKKNKIRGFVDLDDVDFE